MHCVYLSLGSNLGWRKRNIEKAIHQIELKIGHVERLSSFYESASWGYQSKHRYINACAKIMTTLNPEELLNVTQQIERELGRTSKTQNGIYQDRPIDIDILLYDDLTCATERLILPHPHMKERPFVMIPLDEIMTH